MPKCCSATLNKGASTNSLVAEVEAEKQAKRRKFAGRDIPGQAERAICNVLSSEQLEMMSTRVWQGMTMQECVEQEITRQGKNFKLRPRFWQQLFQNFGICQNPMMSVQKPVSGPVPEEMVLCLIKCHNENNCIRGHAVIQLQGILETLEGASELALHGLLSATFSAPVGSRQFLDQLQWLALSFFCRHLFTCSLSDV